MTSAAGSVNAGISAELSAPEPRLTVGAVAKKPNLAAGEAVQEQSFRASWVAQFAGNRGEAIESDEAGAAPAGLLSGKAATTVKKAATLVETIKLAALSTAEGALILRGDGAADGRLATTTGRRTAAASPEPGQIKSLQAKSASWMTALAIPAVQSATATVTAIASILPMSISSSLVSHFGVSDVASNPAFETTSDRPDNRPGLGPEVAAMPLGSFSTTKNPAKSEHLTSATPAATVTSGDRDVLATSVAVLRSGDESLDRTSQLDSTLGHAPGGTQAASQTDYHQQPLESSPSIVPATTQTYRGLEDTAGKGLLASPNLLEADQSRYGPVANTRGAMEPTNQTSEGEQGVSARAEIVTLSVDSSAQPASMTARPIDTAASDSVSNILELTSERVAPQSQSSLAVPILSAGTGSTSDVGLTAATTRNLAGGLDPVVHETAPAGRAVSLSQVKPSLGGSATVRDASSSVGWGPLVSGAGIETEAKPAAAAQPSNLAKLTFQPTVTNPDRVFVSAETANAEKRVASSVDETGDPLRSPADVQCASIELAVSDDGLQKSTSAGSPATSPRSVRVLSTSQVSADAPSYDPADAVESTAQAAAVGAGSVAMAARGSRPYGSSAGIAVGASIGSSPGAAGSIREVALTGMDGRTMTLVDQAKAQPSNDVNPSRSTTDPLTAGLPNGGDAFSALDSASAVRSPGWTHAGTQQAEAGFEDPILGWIGVRADRSAGGIHAAVVPGTVEAAQELGSHMEGLTAYLAGQRTVFESLTMTSPAFGGGHAADTASLSQNSRHTSGQGRGDGAGQSLGHGSNQNSAQDSAHASNRSSKDDTAIGSKERTGSAQQTASRLTGPVSAAGNDAGVRIQTGVDVDAYSGLSSARGGYVSVMA